MPRAAPTPCRHKGCREVVSPAGFCAAHQTEAYTVQRHSRSEDKIEHDRFYARVAWRRVRAYQLSIEPLCRECRKHHKLVVAVIVDHIIPRRNGGADYDMNNLQSLCKRCHDSKTGKECTTALIV